MMVIRSVAGTAPGYPRVVYFDNNYTIVLHFADAERRKFGRGRSLAAAAAND